MGSEEAHFLSVFRFSNNGDWLIAPHYGCVLFHFLGMLINIGFNALKYFKVFALAFFSAGKFSYTCNQKIDKRLDSFRETFMQETLLASNLCEQTAGRLIKLHQNTKLIFWTKVAHRKEIK